MKNLRKRYMIGFVVLMTVSLAIASFSYAAVHASQKQAAALREKADFLQNEPLPGGSEIVQGEQTIGSTNDPAVFTKESLAAFDGKNGHPAYIAINGTVYDVSGIINWAGGFHHGYQAGRDLTEAFGGSPHTLAILDMAKKVGTYTEQLSSAQTSTPADPNQGRTAPAQATPGQSAPTPAAQNNNTAQASSSLTVFTLTQLSAYNGKNGQPAYIAVNGIIYDVTQYWRSGSHHGLRAGTDVTSAFAGSPHSSGLLGSLPQVGVLAAGEQTIDKTIGSPASPNPGAIVGKDGGNDQDEGYEDDDSSEYGDD